MNGLEKLVVVANRLDSLGLVKEADSLDNIIVKFAEVYGSQAVVYHGSRTPPDIFIPAIMSDTFEPGKGSGDMYGKGLYCVYDLEKTQTSSGNYGDYIYKFKVNLYGFICFDSDVAKLVYGEPLLPFEQGEKLGLRKDIIDRLKGIRTFGLGWTSEAAFPASRFLRGKVKGLIFTGAQDGRVAVIYDSTVAVPFGWKKAKRKDNDWMNNDPNYLKPSLRRSALGDWDTEKYDFDPKILLSNLGKLPIKDRVINGNLSLGHTNVTSLPDGLKVIGLLNISDSKIKSLPPGLHVSDLDAFSCDIKSLPDDIRVDGHLYLNGCPIEFLPDNLHVGSLNIRSTNILSLPKNLHINTNLILSRTNINSLPDDLQVGGRIFGFSGDKSNIPKHLIDKV